ncbi:MAG: GH1 family beta-glucosidase [Bacteroidia bacterium]
MLNKKEFGDDFKWGISTAAYQIEGAHQLDGKGASIWDTFSNKKGKIFNNHCGNEACDFYNRYEKDLHLMHFLNIPNFRFSLSWSRIMPFGVGSVNQKGVDFYNRLIDAALELNITPWVTLYHWDLPQKLENKGGWTNREILNWFTEYVALCAKKFGDRVNHWMVMNEPMVFTGAGYFLGIHAPGKKGLINFIPAVHHAALCQSEGARVLKSILPKAEVGTTFSCSHLEPYTTHSKDILATQKVDALINRLFIEPALGLGYPMADLKLLDRIYTYFKPNDEKLLPFDFDFIGIQNYTREIVTHSYFVPLLNAKIIKADKRRVPITLMNWEIYPSATYHILKKYNAYPQIRKLIVTENGAAFIDSVVDGKIEDINRTTYIKNHLKEVLRAKKEGVKVEGYFVWTFTDNFEWAEGFHPRFGLVYTNFKTQERIIKASGYWYKNFLQ